MRLEGIHQSVFSQLLPFTALTHCNLQVLGRSVIQLEPIPHLKELVLGSGSFQNLHVIPHLTKLVLDFARAFSAEPCHFISGLAELHMDPSICQVYHPQGLSACGQLRLLHSHGSRLTADHPWNPNDVVALHADLLLASLTALTGLTELELSFFGAWVDVSTAFSFTNLAKLTLLCKADITAAISSLFRLTSLELFVLDMRTP